MSNTDVHLDGGADRDGAMRAPDVIAILQEIGVPLEFDVEGLLDRMERPDTRR